MATLPPAPQCVRVEMDFTWNGEHCMNVYHCQRADGFGPPPVSAIATTFREWWFTDMRDLVASDLVLNFVRATDLTTDDSEESTDAVGLPNGGNIGTDSVSNNVALIAVWDTHIRRRGAKGRTFVPGLPESSTNGQTVTSSVISDWVGAYAALSTALQALTPNSVLLGLVSYYLNGSLREEGVFHGFFGLTVDTQLGSLRTRLTGRKRKKPRS